MNISPPIQLEPNPLRSLIRELRDAVPWGYIHPSGECIAKEYLAEASHADYAPAALRLVTKAIGKIVEELEWTAALRDGFDDAEAAHLRQEAARFEHWLPRKADAAPVHGWRAYFAGVSRRHKQLFARKSSS
jgi:hypothetical protein